MGVADAEYQEQRLNVDVREGELEEPLWVVSSGDGVDALFAEEPLVERGVPVQVT